MAKPGYKRCYDGCKHYRPLYFNGDAERVCHYILDTGEKRNSDPATCDKFDPGEIRLNSHSKAGAIRMVRCLDTGKVYPSIKIAARCTGARISNISACCRGLRKSTVGLRWAYVEEGEKV